MAAIEAPVGGPLLSGLPQIVALAHSEHSTRGLFSGLAALDKNLEVTLRSSPFCRKLFNLKRNHLVYLRILDWAMGVLDEIPVTILQLPNSASPGTPNVFSQKQARCLERAFARIDPRARRAAPILRPAGAVAVGELQCDLECFTKVACRTSSGNVASFAMSESSWSGNEKVASRFIRFLAAAYGVVASPAGPTIEQQGEHLATTLDATLPHRIRRFLALLREGGRKHLVGGNNAPLKMGTIDNMASALGHFYAKGTRDFAGQLPHVLGCASRAKAHHLIHTAVRGAREIASGETHTGNPVLDSTEADWLSGAAK
ncbi:hypothetical protein I4F81_001645 [Pyropia yezoensis]|uniref:Uncharacterized protein n=1 Tax=Pyropia yezoensis TaxID=2788 RepID=A0ACC3BNG4_PYRYE|nr:hypothetical protein I4F81_001645 [Neopyropia yezoensis]